MCVGVRKWSIHRHYSVRMVCIIIIILSKWVGNFNYFTKFNHIEKQQKSFKRHKMQSEALKFPVSKRLIQVYVLCGKMCLSTCKSAHQGGNVTVDMKLNHLDNELDQLSERDQHAEDFGTRFSAHFKVMLETTRDNLSRWWKVCQQHILTLWQEHLTFNFHRVITFGWLVQCTMHIVSTRK